MPITVSLKLVFQNVPELNRWAELMSRDWQTPAVPSAVEDLPPDCPGPPGASLPREPEPAARA